MSKPSFEFKYPGQFTLTPNVPNKIEIFDNLGINICAPYEGCSDIGVTSSGTYHDGPVLNIIPLSGVEGNIDSLQIELYKQTHDGSKILLLNCSVVKETSDEFSFAPSGSEKIGNPSFHFNRNLINNKILMGFSNVLSVSDVSQYPNLIFHINEDFSIISDITVFFLLQNSSTMGSDTNSTENSNQGLINKGIIPRPDDLFVQVFVQSDILGLNLGEIIAIIDAKKSYPNGYPKLDIGTCSGGNLPFITPQGLIQTFYSKRPDLPKVLKGKPQSSLFEQIIKINEKYNTGLSNCQFYDNIVEYAALKYIFGGLCSGCFSLNWLYANNNDKFIKCMEKSEFAKFLVIFDEYRSEGYDKYFKSSQKSHHKCPNTSHDKPRCNRKCGCTRDTRN